MSGIMISLNYNRRVAIDDKPLASNEFSADFLLNPDGDYGLSRKYGYMRLRLDGDSSKIPNDSLADVERWMLQAIRDMLDSKLGSEA